jgi:hypothetical protein
MWIGQRSIGLKPFAKETAETIQPKDRPFFPVGKRITICDAIYAVQTLSKAVAAIFPHSRCIETFQ